MNTVPCVRRAGRLRVLAPPLAGAVVLGLGLGLGLGGPAPAAAQGTWMHTLCLAGAGTQTACKAPPAWGQTGVDHVQALATAAGPGNLGLSLVKPETLPAANAARAQLAAVMLGYLDNGRPLAAYRWYGPVVAPSAGPRRAGATAPGAGTAAQNAAATRLPLDNPAAPAASPAAGQPPAAATATLQTSWRAGALGDDPQTLSASWWLAGSFFGPTLPVEVDASADRYRVIRFLADHCPQLEGRVAPNAWTRCTRNEVAEPGTAGLAALALLLAGAARPLSVRWQRRRQPAPN